MVTTDDQAKKTAFANGPCERIPTSFRLRKKNSFKNPFPLACPTGICPMVQASRKNSFSPDGPQTRKIKTTVQADMVVGGVGSGVGVSTCCGASSPPPFFEMIFKVVPTLNDPASPTV